MQTKKITYKKLVDLINQCNNYMRSVPEKKKTALSVKITRILDSLNKESNRVTKEYTSEIEDIRTDHCSLDSDLNMIIKEGAKGEDRYVFKPEKLKAMRKLINAIDLDNREVEIDINITANVPKDITYHMAKAFRGIIIPEDYEYKEEIEDEEAQ